MESVDVRPNEADVFDLRPANDWMKEAGDERAKMLFGELWMSGELCVMFGEAGVGKSLLAVQIADSIAKGRAVAPFGMDAREQKVLYVDLEKTASQFRQRYTETEAKGSGRRRRYTFSKRFSRMAPNNGGEVRVRDIERLIEKSGTKVLIIDSLPHIVRGGLPREAATVMRDLRRLRSAYGLSILVVANSARSTMRRGIAAADMAWAGTLAALADNIFAIGRCGSQSGGRYIKHIKPRSAPLVYGTATVPQFEIEQVKGTYPSFVHGVLNS